MTWFEKIKARMPASGLRAEVTRASGIKGSSLSRYLATGKGLSAQSQERLALALGLDLVDVRQGAEAKAERVTPGNERAEAVPSAEPVATEPDPPADAPHCARVRAFPSANEAEAEPAPPACVPATHVRADSKPKSQPEPPRPAPTFRPKKLDPRAAAKLGRK